VEAYAGTHGLLRKYGELGGSVQTISELAERAHSGEKKAITVFESMGTALGSALTTIQNVLDLEALVFTGGISQSFELVEPSLRRTLTARVFARPLGEVPILLSELGSRAGVIGAAHLPDALNGP
jgi:glucokinase